MPLKLVAPKEGRSSNYRARGTYLGRTIDRSLKTGDKSLAKKLLRALEEKIERGAVSTGPDLTFARAATSYMQAGGERRFMKRIIAHFGTKLATELDQAAIDGCAAALYPDAPGGTRNRNVYTPVLAVLHHAGLNPSINRPRDAQGQAFGRFLSPDQFERTIAVAAAQDREFALLMQLLAYTGVRLSEALRVACDGIDLQAATAICGRTKNGLPRALHLPPRVVAALAAHPRGLDRGDDRLFRWRKGSELYLLAARVYLLADVDVQGDAARGEPFHILRHTYGAWMTRAGADLVATNAWRSPTAARVYNHFVTTEEARKADLLPGSGALPAKTPPRKRAPRAKSV